MAAKKSVLSIIPSTCLNRHIGLVMGNNLSSNQAWFVMIQTPSALQFGLWNKAITSEEPSDHPVADQTRVPDAEITRIADADACMLKKILNHR